MGRFSRAPRLLAITLAGLLLAGCAAGPQYRGNRHYAAGRPHYTVAPYEVDGVWYYPAVNYHYDRTGTASWYGPGFDGRATADGEIYDMNGLSAAHKTLPLPSVVEVTNLDNGRELTLRVNDRGPFVDGRLIDLSRRAAQLLGFERQGTAPVRVRVLKEPSIEVAEAAMLGDMGPVQFAGATQAQPIELAAAASPSRPAPLPPPEPQPPSPQFVAAPPQPAYVPVAAPPPQSPPQQLAIDRDYWPSLIASAHAATLYPPARPAWQSATAPPHERIFIQAGAFSVRQNARWVQAQIATLGSTKIVPARLHGVALYRVRLGPVTSDAAALRLLSAVLERGFGGAQLVEE
jgi:rare lipoprotein A